MNENNRKPERVIRIKPWHLTAGSVLIALFIAPTVVKGLVSVANLTTVAKGYVWLLGIGGVFLVLVDKAWAGKMIGVACLVLAGWLFFCTIGGQS
jgi:hypothetical protein